MLTKKDAEWEPASWEILHRRYRNDWQKLENSGSTVLWEKKEIFRKKEIVSKEFAAENSLKYILETVYWIWQPGVGFLNLNKNNISKMVE